MYFNISSNSAEPKNLQKQLHETGNVQLQRRVVFSLQYLHTCNKLQIHTAMPLPYYAHLKRAEYLLQPGQTLRLMCTASITIA